MKKFINKIKEILNTPKKQILAGFLAILLATSLITGAYYFKVNPPKKKDKPIVDIEDESQDNDDEVEDDIVEDDIVEDDTEESESVFTEEIVNGEREVIPFETSTKDDDSKYEDFEEIVQHGVNGERLYKDRVYYENGIEYKRDKNISNEVTKDPVTKIVVKGTKKNEPDDGDVVIPEEPNDSTDTEGSDGDGN